MCEIIHLAVHGPEHEYLYLSKTKHSLSAGIVYLDDGIIDDGSGYDHRYKTKIIMSCFFSRFLSRVIF